MIQDLSGSWCIKGTGESMARVDSSVSSMHHDLDRSWITDNDPDHPKGTHPKVILIRYCRNLLASEIQAMYVAHSIEMFFFATNVYLQGNLRVRLATSL